MWHPAAASVTEWVPAPQGPAGLPSAPLAGSPGPSLRGQRMTGCSFRESLNFTVEWGQRGRVMRGGEGSLLRACRLFHH